MDELIGKLKSSIPVTRHPPTDDSPNPANGNTGTKKASASVLFVAAAKEERSTKTHFGSPQIDLEAHLLKVSLFFLKKKGRETQHLLV